MPVIWQSSQRPMHVRTIWVDGCRHAILTHDDPYYQKIKAKRNRPYSSASCANRKPTSKRESRLSNHGEDLEDCLRKLHLVSTRSYKTNDGRHQRPKSCHFQHDIEKLDLEDTDIETEKDFGFRTTRKPLNELETSRSDDSLNMRTLRTNRTSRTDEKENNGLSERVLQWLDLAGKVDLLAPQEEAVRMSQPRHSWPELQRRNVNKAKTTADLRPKPDTYKEIAPNEPVHERGDIDRDEFHVPPPANTIENYARQSRKGKCTPRSEFLPRHKGNVKTKTRELKIVHETRQKMESEKSAVERQYAELVSKKILPDYGKSKKQVHIFIPEVPKKSASNVASRTESLLSQVSLNNSKP